MDCDRVFFVLTAGPFPTGSEIDFSIEQHLSHCESCRSLSEALRPAPELFHESLTPNETEDLPIYHALPVTSNCLVGSSVQKIHSKQNRPIRPVPEATVYAVPAVRWSHMITSVDVGQWSDTAMLVALSLTLSLTALSLGWLVM